MSCRASLEKASPSMRFNEFARRVFARARARASQVRNAFHKGSLFWKALSRFT